MDQLLKEFARAIATGPTRAVVDRATGSFTVYEVDGPAEEDIMVVAQLKPARDLVVGRIGRPAPGWVEIGGTAYPEPCVEIRGPVLFVARPAPAAPAEESQDDKD